MNQAPAVNISRNISYNKPFFTGKEQFHIDRALKTGTISGNGSYTHLCQALFRERFHFRHCLLTHSCSSALEMAAILCDLKKGDEVIVPSFGYVTTASAFHARGATLVFADSEQQRPHVDPESIREKITENTKALVIIHYGGSGCDMKKIMEIVEEHGLLLIEDCAHAINARYLDRYLGNFGHFSTFSFHETKNIHCGEGGMLVVNDEASFEKAMQVWQEGTNRSDYEKGLVGKYEWVSHGSSYQLSELEAAFLYAQAQQMDTLHDARMLKWRMYHDGLRHWEKCHMIHLPEHPGQEHNAHIFYINCRSRALRDNMIGHLNAKGIMALFHYLPLHTSPYWLQANALQKLKHAEDWSGRILRLPLYHALTPDDQEYILHVINEFLSKPEPGK